ncbi:MAG: NAD(P)-binding domain-containing protein [Myxococcota bacterium]|nr:NAD(P)-binding domain-containing protein [Myxococcota bacterium]MDP7075050.1 NAD(P)-binding domain-containing protein [Myxococcota bacterium]MDP7299889.1 NAD(P)-binding domain-containing protein [Myxococcota bacterium]MDP7432493.1 NAD(P)-binding domain-containing protein [Myxococcota bacterium]HJO24512.1 NAD(P)-binding domain-containing protein [Myxococcota bacterium]
MPLPETTPALIYLVLLACVMLPYARRRIRRNAASLALLEEAHSDGLMEPASLHPVIDPGRCFGCAACVKACPECDVLGILYGRAVLTTPANCIGHGACRKACPRDAITLVLGSETRGVEIPMLGEDFQTNVPGIYVAGELGGMGLIRNAIEQGKQALAAIAQHPGVASGDSLDVLIVGAGPAGFAASLAARERGLRARTIEQETLGGTVAHYPRGKIVMTAPVELPLVGAVKLRKTTKEALLELWTRVASQTGIEITYQERVTSIVRAGKYFRIETNRGTYEARTVLLAIGRRGTPRKLEVPGEESEKVLYRLIDPTQYRGKHVLVVGGGDSALEAAVALCEEPGTQVSLSYRGETFSRAKQKNREAINEATTRGDVHMLLQTEVISIGEKTVSLRLEDEVVEIPNDAVIVCAGGVLPTSFLRAIGVDMETKWGTL